MEKRIALCEECKAEIALQERTFFELAAEVRNVPSLMGILKLKRRILRNSCRLQSGAHGTERSGQIDVDIIAERLELSQSGEVRLFGEA